MPSEALLAIIVFGAIFTQTVAGAGLALIAMPLLVGLIDPVAAAVLVAMMALTTQSFMLARYHPHIQIRPLRRLILGSVVAIPIGILALAQLDRHIILTALGIILVGYSLYSLKVPRLPSFDNPRYEYLFGFASGLLGGAFNTGGPPFMIYLMSQQWPTARYKGNLQVLLMVNSLAVFIIHLLTGHVTGEVVRYYILAIPVIALGTFAGFTLDKYIDHQTFRKLVFVLLLIIGVRLLLP